MKLFVDDLRYPPEGWHVVRTVTEAIRVLQTQWRNITHVSLDHDIEGSNETFEAVARFIAVAEAADVLAGNESHLTITIHSANPVATENMKKILGI